MVDGAGNHIKGIEDFLTRAQYWPDTPPPRQGRRGRAAALPCAFPRQQVPRNSGDEFHPRGY